MRQRNGLLHARAIVLHNEFHIDRIALALEEAVPDDGLLGEEGAAKPSRSGRRWIIDPIDGTRDYVRGIPVWATLIGLEQDGEVVAGVAHFAGRAETYFASRGSGAFC